jgi:hypothetical protein
MLEKQKAVGQNLAISGMGGNIDSATATLHIAAAQQKSSGFKPTLLVLLEAGPLLRFLLIALRKKNLRILASFFSSP